MIDTPWFRGLALGLFLLGGASAEGLALHPHNETLPLAPFRPDLSSPWSGAARPGDQVLLPRDDLPESPEGLQVRLQGLANQGYPVCLQAPLFHFLNSEKMGH